MIGRAILEKKARSSERIGSVCESRGLWSSLVKVKPPYDLAQSIAAAASFAPTIKTHSDSPRFVIRVNRRAVVVEVEQSSATSLRASFASGVDRRAVQRAVSWIVLAELDLSPFYALVADHPILGVLVHRFRGVKPLRPSDLFEMAVIAITEQQISLAAAYAIRTRLIERFGTRVEEYSGFPEPRTFARATVEQLCACGLSHAKAQYIHALARSLEERRLDLDAVARMSDEEAREALMKVRGFGPWSAEYILVRGMARPDRVPFEDLGVRDVVGRQLGGGTRVSAAEAKELLAPFEPYRGLAAFYLLVAARTQEGQKKSVELRATA